MAGDLYLDWYTPFYNDDEILRGIVPALPTEPGIPRPLYTEAEKELFRKKEAEARRTAIQK